VDVPLLLPYLLAIVMGLRSHLSRRWLLLVLAASFVCTIVKWLDKIISGSYPVTCIELDGAICVQSFAETWDVAGTASFAVFACTIITFFSLICFFVRAARRRWMT
jgi:hypothetical protein